MVKAIRDGVYDAYTRPGALSRLRYEAATGKGIPRNADDWRALQAGLQEFRNREDGTRSAPFEKPKEHDSEYAHAPPNSDQRIVHEYTRRMSQQLEDEQLTEGLQAQMGTDASRSDNRSPSMRESLEAAYALHTPASNA